MNYNPRTRRSLLVLALLAVFTLGVGPCVPWLSESGYVYGISEYAGYLYYSVAQEIPGPNPPDQIKRVSVNGGTPTLITTTNAEIDSIRVDSSGIYFFASVGDRYRAALYHVGFGGGTPEQLWLGGADDDVTDFVLATNNIFFLHYNSELATGADSSYLKRIPKTGGSVTTLAGPNFDMYDDIAIDSNWVYYASCEGNFIRRVNRSDTTIFQALLSPNSGIPCPLGLAVDASYVFFTSGDKVYRVPLTGGSAALLYAGATTAGIRPYSLDAFVDANNYYWYMKFQQSSFPYRVVNRWLRKIPRTGGTPVLLADEINSEYWAADATAIYAGVEGGVYKISKY